MNRVYEVMLRRRYILVASALFTVYMYGWSTKWSFNPTTPHGLPTDHYFTAQADAILRGRLWVDQVVNQPGGGVAECFFVNGHCFGHWGVSPSLLRIPLLLIFGSFTLSLSNIMIPLASGIALCAFLDLCRQVAAPLLSKQRYVAFMLTGSVVLGPGSVLVLVGDPYVYQEALVWSVAGIAVAINLFHRWWSTNQASFLVGTIIACCFAAGSKSTSALVGIPLAIAVALKYKDHIARRRMAVILCGLLAVAPVVVSCGSNLAKFGQLTFDWKTYQNPLNREPQSEPLPPCVIPGEFSPRFIPTNLFTYLRPDAVRLFKEWPYVRFRFGWCEGPNAPTFLWPLEDASLYVEKTTSVPITMPVPLVATVASLVLIARRRRWHELLIFASVATTAISTTVTMTLTSRYLAEFYPLMAVGFAFSARAVETIKKSQILMGIGLAVALLTLWSLVANASLATRYYWIYL